MVNKHKVITSKKKSKKSKDHFPVVGIGSSAGGLEAYSSLIESLPNDTNMAFVVIQHLDPTHKSNIVDILSKLTSLPVLEAADGLELLPNHIYVIPPNVQMVIKENFLHLTPRAESPIPFLSIDYFFKSLAVSRKNNAFGIVLSGTGNDGTKGSEEIKLAGGFTFAQDEVSAKFFAMPKHAIDSGFIDFVLPANKMINKIIKIAKNPYMFLVKEENTLFNDDKASFDTILTLIETYKGIDFTAYRDTTLKRRIMRRMAVHNKTNLIDYLNFIKNNVSEIDTLCQDLLINVTRFFREPQVFETLKNTVFPEIFKNKTSDSHIRIWVPGCSTGQEAYSIAMILLEYLDNKGINPNIKIFASDLSDSYALNKARKGTYPRTIESEVSPERLSRFFLKLEEKYCVNQVLREMCIFTKHDVTTDPPFSKLDLISCRNLLIYFSVPLQKQIIQTFYFSLNLSGYLLLGISETVGNFTNLFGTVDKKQHIYIKTETNSEQYRYFNTKSYKEKYTQELKSNLKTTITAKDWQNAADLIVLSKYAPAGVLVNEKFDILQFRGRTNNYLEIAPGEPSHNLLRMASQGLFSSLHSAIDECQKQNTTVIRKNVQVTQIGSKRKIDVLVFPVTLPQSLEKQYLVLFEENSSPVTNIILSDNVSPEQDEIDRLNREIASMHDYLQYIIEKKNIVNDELHTHMEEMLSNNEELQSTNEEVETAKEELQSINEELNTVNEQLDNRNKDLKSLNDDLLVSTRYSMAILDTVREPLIVLDMNFRIQTANQAFYTTFQVASDQTINCFLWDLGNRHWDIPELRVLLNKTLHEKVNMQDFIVSSKIQKIGFKIFLLNARIIVKQSNEEPLILLAIEDITQRKMLENELQKSTAKLAENDRHKDQFLAMLAHELRNPLAPISNGLAILSLPNSNADMLKEIRNTIECQVDHLICLVDDLLDITRINNNKIVLHLKNVELSQLIKKAVEISASLVNKSGYQLIISLPEKPLWIEVDPIRMEQVLSNMINNAVKYAKLKGHIWLSVECKNRDIVIKVKDDGIGIAAEMQSHIFEMFTQIDSSIEHSQGGIGIGLSLVKSLVNLHGGTVSVKSEGLGKGSEFSIHLPSIVIPTQTIPNVPANKNPPPLHLEQIKKVLVVDDNKASALTMGALIESLGHTVKVVHNGVSAIAVAKDFLPNIILLDIGLPDINGYKVCHSLRQESLLKNVIIAAQTGWGYKLSKEAGFDYHFVKPVRLNTLQKLLSTSKIE